MGLTDPLKIWAIQNKCSLFRWEVIKFYSHRSISYCEKEHVIYNDIWYYLSYIIKLYVSSDVSVTHFLLGEILELTFIFWGIQASLKLGRFGAMTLASDVPWHQWNPTSLVLASPWNIRPQGPYLLHYTHGLRPSSTWWAQQKILINLWRNSM